MDYQNTSLLPSLNGHSLAWLGAIDPGPFSTARGLPADDLRHLWPDFVLLLVFNVFASIVKILADFF